MAARDALGAAAGRLSRLRPSTLLLGAIALWAVLFAALALSGLGRHVRLLPDDPALVDPLPKPELQRSEGRLGPIEQYAAATARPLFNLDRKPAPVEAGETGEDKPFDAVLTGVILTDTLKMALVQSANEQKSVGVRLDQPLASAPGWRLIAVEPRRAIFEGPTGRTTLEQRVFDGRSGEPPTAVAEPEPPQGQPEMPPGPGEVRPPPPPPLIATPDGAAAAAAEPETLTPEQQVEAIRRRIEARRAQLRQQQNAPTTPQEQ